MEKVTTLITEYGDDWFSITGPQLYSAVPVKMHVQYRGDAGPARFRYRGMELEAHVSNIRDHDELGLTTIGRDDLRIRQIEHILSALMGLSVLDSTITLEYVDGGSDQPVISPPVCNLSAREFGIAVLSTFHRRPAGGPLRPALLNGMHVIREKDPATSSPSVAVFAPLHKLNVTSHIHFPGFIGTQIISIDINPLEYLRGICWARSFFTSAFPHNREWEDIRGIFPAVLREEENHLRSMMVDHTETGWITPVVVNTEPVRHKLLDFLGDIALVGCAFNAGVYVYKPHHKFNRQCAIEIAPHLSQP